MRLMIVLALLAVACGTREETALPPPAESPALGDPPQSDPAPPTDTSPAPDQRPATREDTVTVEGMPEVVTSQLVTSPSGFPVPFSTYVPPGLNTSFEQPGAVKFTAAFAGNVNPRAYMLVRVYGPGSPRPSASDVLDELMRSSGADEHETVPADRPGWALETIGFRYIAADTDRTNFTGSITIGQHGDSYFHIVRNYPVEYGDGLPPRLHTILRHWRWEDTGEMLMQ